MQLTENTIRSTYVKLKHKALMYLNKGNIHKTLLYVHLASYTDHSFFLSYQDDELERILKQVSDSINKKQGLSVKPLQHRCVMLDSLSRYRGGLAVQYINAIVASGWELLYITSQEIDAPQRRELKSFLSSLANVTVLEVPSRLRGIEKLQYIYDEILAFSPSKLYCHLNAYDAYLSTIAYAVPSSISKFIINITDHASQLGFKSCQYSFEFRELGCSISTTHRGINPDNILYLPFYPILDNVPFNGLPDICKDKTIIMSGGRYFKIIDENDTYFKLVKKITDAHTDSVVLFPGSEDDTLIRIKIKEYNLENKLILLGWRDDISELFRRSVMYLNTYPHGGATLAQYAAHLHIPILSYQPEGTCLNPVETCVCQDGYTTISSVGEEAFMAEANLLLLDREYAKQKASLTYQCVLGKDKFNSYFKRMSETFSNIINFNINNSVDLNAVQRQKLILYQSRVGEFQMRLFALCGLNSITARKEYILPFIKKIIPKLVKTISSRGFHFNRF